MFKVLYETKSTLLGLAVALAFTMPIDAAQYTVPEGQPLVPGADASIPDVHIRTIVTIRLAILLLLITLRKWKSIISGLMERFLRKKVQRRQSN